MTAIDNRVTTDLLVARAQAAHPSAVIACEPSDDGKWMRLSDLVTGEFLADRMRALGERLEGPPELQVTYSMGWLAAPIVIPLVHGYQSERALPLVDFDEVLVRCHPQGWYDGVAIGRPELIHAGDFVDEQAFGAALVERVVALMGPAVQYALPLSPLGRRTVWAAVADRLVQTLMPATRTDPEGPAAVAHIERLMAAAGPLAMTRRWNTVDTPAGKAIAPVGAACCFSYRSIEAEHCPTACPKLDDATLAANLLAECTGQVAACH